MEIISNIKEMIEPFSMLFDVFDEKSLLNEKIDRALKSMKLYVVIMGNDEQIIKEIIDDSISTEADEEFIDFFKGRKFDDDEFFISSVTHDNDDNIDYVYTTVVGLKPIAANGHFVVSFTHAISQFVHLFKDMGALGSYISPDNVNDVISSVVDSTRHRSARARGW